MQPESSSALFECTIHCDQRETEHGTAPDQIPGQMPVAKKAARQAGKQLRLGSGEFLAANTAWGVVVQQLQYRSHNKRGHCHAAYLHHLLAARRGSDQLAGLEIVAHIAGRTCRTAHHRGHAQGCQHAGRARKAKQDEHDPGTQHGGDGHT